MSNKKDSSGINFNDFDAPVPGSSAWIVQNNKRAKLKKDEKLIDDMSDDFPMLQRMYAELKSREEDEGEA